MNAWSILDTCPGIVSGGLDGVDLLSIDVRLATIADAEHVAGLVTALGYPTSAAQMRTRLESILADDDYATLVASDGEQIVGFVGTRIGPLYESDGLYGQIMALAVETESRRRGIGRTLVHAAESMLRTRGVSVFVVTSGHQRADAHAFYEKNGYTFTGRRYMKRV
jgi:ribosomal protein S18 acetylase RimI-like enzyme